MNRQHDPRLARGRRAKGAITVEFVLSLLVLMFILIGGLTFAHAMLVRYQLSNAAFSAARACAAAGQANDVCVRTSVEAALGRYAEFCDPLTPVQGLRDLGGDITGLEVVVECGYTRFPGAELLRRDAQAAGVGDPGALVLRGRSVIPVE